MNYTTLGRTGLRVSVLGLGGGGHSRLGQATGADRKQSIAIVQRAFELGVNIVDTAEAYVTETIIGESLSAIARDTLVLSTKKTMLHQDRLITGDELRQGLEESLRHLNTDRVEIYHLHGVRAEQYDYAREHLVPVLQRLREQGKIRFLGLTEAFASDPAHRMMARAVQDDCWDVVMVGFNILNQSARERIFPHTQQRGIGVLNMFAVRRALSQPAQLQNIVAELVKQGAIPEDAVPDCEEPLSFLTQTGVAHSMTDAAYRFCRMEPGIDVVLTGTSSLQHLEENVNAALRPPLPPETRERLIRMFAGVDSVSGQ